MKIRFQQVFVAAIAALGIAVLAAPGCGGSSADTCEGVNAKLCEKACGCGGAKCAIGTGLTVTFDNQADCEKFLGLGCGSSSKDVDFSACSAALESAQCANSALVEPAACSSSGSGGGGSASSSSGSADAGTD